MEERTMLACFSGEIASGKTTVSTVVAKRLGWKRASFGDHLRRTHPDVSRREIQEFGQNWVQDDPEGLCKDVLTAGGFSHGESFVLDGVRHVAALQHLVEIARPTQVRLFFLDVPIHLRRQRASGRGAGDRQDFERASEHVVEAESKQLLEVAHEIIDGAPSVDFVATCCVHLIECWLSGLRD